MKPNRKDFAQINRAIKGGPKERRRRLNEDIRFLGRSLKKAEMSQQAQVQLYPKNVDELKADKMYFDMITGNRVIVTSVRNGEAQARYFNPVTGTFESFSPVNQQLAEQVNNQLQAT